MRKGQRSFSHPNSVATVTALPACATSVWGGQVSAWQALSGLVSLQEEHRSGAKPPDLKPALPAERPTLPRTSLPSHWGQVREPLGRGASSSRAAPFKPMGSGGGDPGRLQLSTSQPEEREEGWQRAGGERRGVGRSWRGEEKDDKGLGVSYPGRHLSGRFMVWSVAAEWEPLGLTSQRSTLPGLLAKYAKEKYRDPAYEKMSSQRT